MDNNKLEELRLKLEREGFVCDIVKYADGTTGVRVLRFPFTSTDKREYVLPEGVVEVRNLRSENEDVNGKFVKIPHEITIVLPSTLRKIVNLETFDIVTGEMSPIRFVCKSENAYAVVRKAAAKSILECVGFEKDFVKDYIAKEATNDWDKNDSLFVDETKNRLAKQMYDKYVNESVSIEAEQKKTNKKSANNDGRDDG